MYEIETTISDDGASNPCYDYKCWMSDYIYTVNTLFSRFCKNNRHRCGLGIYYNRSIPDSYSVDNSGILHYSQVLPRIIAGEGTGGHRNMTYITKALLTHRCKLNFAVMSGDNYNLFEKVFPMHPTIIQDEYMFESHGYTRATAELEVYVIVSLFKK